MYARSKIFTAGLLAVVPMLPGVASFGVIAGLTAVGTGLSAAQAMTLSVTVFAGASQLATLQLINDGAIPAVILLTALTINLRFAMYSASLAPHLQHLGRRWQLPLAYFLVDQNYAVSIRRYQVGDAEWSECGHWYYLVYPATDIDPFRAPRIRQIKAQFAGNGRSPCQELQRRAGESGGLPSGEALWGHLRRGTLGAGVALWITWQTATAVGVFMAAGVPRGWSLDFAIPLVFMVLLVPSMRNRAHVVAAVVGGTVAVLAAEAPLKLGIVIGALSGIAAGVLCQRYGRME